MNQKQKKPKTENGYWDGPPPPDEFASLKPKLPANRISPAKGYNTTSIAVVTPGLVLSSKAHAQEIINNNNTNDQLLKTKETIANCHASVQTQTECSTNTKGLQQDEKAFFVAKIIRKPETSKNKEQDLNLKVDTFLAYTKVVDDPTRQQIASELLFSDIKLLEGIKEVDDDDIEPHYVVFGEGQPLCRDHADISAEWKINNDCGSCYCDCCDEWRFGQYCVSAVKRYWEETQHTANEKDAYVTFVAHYNRVLDWHSYGEGSTHRLRPTETTKPPHCMRKGSLKFSLEWIKWQIENGSEKDYYDEKRRIKKIELKEKQAAKELKKKEFKPTRSGAYRYSGRKRK